MTIDQAIKTVDKLRPSGVAPFLMRGWLSQLDARIKTELYSKRVTARDIPFEPYTDETPGNTILLAPEAYSMLYIHWLCYNIDYNYGENERAYADKTHFNEIWSDLAAYVARTYPSASSGHFVI